MGLPNAGMKHSYIHRHPQTKVEQKFKEMFFTKENMLAKWKGVTLVRKVKQPPQGRSTSRMCFLKKVFSGVGPVRIPMFFCI